MLKDRIQNSLTVDFDPPLIADEKHYSVRDYGRPIMGGVVYALAYSALIGIPMIFMGGLLAAWVVAVVAAIMVIDMAATMGIAACIHHRIFVHRLRKYGPSYYNTEIEVDTPPAEAFELCLAATSDLPKSKIVKMDEKAGTMLVSIKGNFWITVDRQLTLRVRQKDHSQSVISIDPSIKLTSFRRRFMRLIWGDKWYPLIFRSDVNWNRKILNQVTTYIQSVPNWDHRYEQPELMDHGYINDMNEMNEKSAA